MVAGRWRSRGLGATVEVEAIKDDVSQPETDRSTESGTERVVFCLAKASDTHDRRVAFSLTLSPSLAMRSLLPSLALLLFLTTVSGAKNLSSTRILQNTTYQLPLNVRASHTYHLSLLSN